MENASYGLAICAERTACVKVSDIHTLSLWVFNLIMKNLVIMNIMCHNLFTITISASVYLFTDKYSIVWIVLCLKDDQQMTEKECTYIYLNL